MTPNESNAAPVSSMSDNRFKDTAGPTFHEDDVAAEIAEALSSAISSVPTLTTDSADEPAEEVGDSLHEQLAALVQALASEEAREPIPEDEAASNEFVLPEMPEQCSLVAHEGVPDAPHPPEEVHATENEGHLPENDGHVPEAYVMPPEIGSAPVAAEGNAVSRRLVGFAAGIVASVAVGGGMILFEVGMSEPPAAASSDAPKLQSRLADVTSPPAKPVEEPQAAEPEAAEPAPVIVSAGVTVQVPDSASATASTDPIESLPEVAASTEPSATVAQAEPDASARPLDQMADPAPEIAVDRQQDRQLGRAKPRDFAQFQTTIEPSASESKQVLSRGAEHSTEQEDIETAAADARIAHAVMHVNLRAGPSNGEAVLAIVPEGSPVEIIQCGQWCEVSFGGQQGWIYKDFISVPAGESSIN